MSQLKDIWPSTVVKVPASVSNPSTGTPEIQEYPHGFLRFSEIQWLQDKVTWPGKSYRNTCYQLFVRVVKSLIYFSQLSNAIGAIGFLKISKTHRWFPIVPCPSTRIGYHIYIYIYIYIYIINIYLKRMR